MRKAPARPANSSSSATPLIALGVIAIGAAFYHRSAACAALGVVLLAMPGLLFFMLWRSLRGVCVERQAPRSAFTGDRVTVRLLIRNGSSWPIFLPRVTDVFSPDEHELKDVLFPFRVEPGETLEESYKAACNLPRGIYELGPTVAVLSDPLGWFQVRKVFHDTRPFKVYPQYREIGAREENGSATSPVFEEIARSLIGDSTEIFAVREYRIGDPLRRVHWGLTAHRGFPVVREFAHNTVGDLCIFLDLHRQSLVGVGRGSSLEHSVKLAASLAAHALRRGFRVEVAGQGKTALQAPLAAGPGQLQVVLDALVGARPDGDVPLSTLIAGRARGLEAGSRVVIPVSAQVRDSGDLETQILALKRSGVHVVVLVFDATFKNLEEMHGNGRSVEEYLAFLGEVGIEAHRVPCGADLAQVFSDLGQISGGR